MLSQEEVKKRIERDLKLHEISKAQYLTLRPERHAAVYYSPGVESREIAVDYILLGDKSAAISWLEKAAEYYLRNVEKTREFKNVLLRSDWEPEPGTCEDALNMALLSGNKEAIARAVHVTLGISDDYPREVEPPIPNYYYAKSLAYFIKGDRERSLELAKKIERKEKQFQSYFEGLKTSLLGLIESDKAMILDGLRRILEYHHRMNSGDLSGSGLVCFHASALIRLARDSSIIIGQDDIIDKYRRYIPWELLTG